jgi:phenylpropionate dioxygenase-like ring-hydroxylating dioxygenase large terminal subunit
MLAPSQFPDLTPDLLTTVPLERSETIPSAWYTDPRFHELDREAVFGAGWQHVGHAEQLTQPGDLLVDHVAGNPVMVVRDKEGVLRAFYNVCRHRGGPLALKDGNCEMLQCKYHGWTYQLDGMLRGVPHMNRTELFDKQDYGLVPIRHAVWEGLVFVSLAANGAALTDLVRGITERIGKPGLSALQAGPRVEYDVRCNWKVYVDNFLEGYHVPYVHPELLKLYDYSQYRTEVFDWYSLQVGPLSGGDNIYGARDGEALYYHIFPNFMLNILPGRLQTNLVVPIAPDRCKVIFRYYYADVASAAARKLIGDDLAYSEGVQREDIEICERVQQGLASRAYDRGRFSVPFEGGVHHFQSLLRAAYRNWISAAPAARD